VEVSDRDLFFHGYGVLMIAGENTFRERYIFIRMRELGGADVGRTDNFAQEVHQLPSVEGSMYRVCR